MDRPKIGRSAKWGRACASCAAARTRCIRGQSSGPQQPCDRCRSLEKDCVGQTPGPRKKGKTRTSALHDTRMALLEERSDDLASTSRTPIWWTSNARGNLVDGSLHNHLALSNGTSSEARDTPSQLETAPRTPAHETSPGAPTGPKCTCMTTGDVEVLAPPESDETLLSIYRNQLSGSLPFVIIPAGTTSRQLQASRPFLMKVIRMVASVRDLRSVRGQSRAVMEHISDAMLMRSERSLDLLQGILVFLGSYHYHCMVHAQFNNLIRLAVSLVEDLDLGTCPESQQRGSRLPLARGEKAASRTNEEKRALLGVWYMSSNAGLVAEQLAFTRYTRYMDQCLRDLDEAGEYKTDQFALQLIRIQRLTEKIFLFHDSDSPVDEQHASPEPSTMTSLEAFRVELDSLRNELPSHLKSDHLLSCYYNRAYLWISAPLLAGSHLPDTESQSFALLQLSGVPMADIFSTFTAALKAWLESWLAMPVCSYFYMPQPAYTQLVYGAMMLSRWVRLAGPGAVTFSRSGSATGVSWRPTPALSGVPSCPDLSLPTPPSSQASRVASTQILNTIRTKVAAQPDLQIDVLGVLDAMAARFEAAKKEMAVAQGVEWENDTWDFAAEHSKMKKARVKKWCEVVAMATSKGSPLNDTSNTVRDRSGEGMNALSEWSLDDFAWATPGYDQDIMQWESFLFDEMLQDLHT